MHFSGHLWEHNMECTIKHTVERAIGQDCCCMLLQLLSKASMLVANTSMLLLLACHGLQGCQADPSSCCRCQLTLAAMIANCRHMNPSVWLC
jgi:hypothetical protein